MPDFKGEQALNYDDRITRLVPGYELLHGLVASQLQVLLPAEGTILIVGAGTGKEVMALAALNPKWQFVVQDISADMLKIADQNFTNLGLSERVTIHCGSLDSLAIQADATLCLLVLHFLKDDGEKRSLLKAMAKLTQRGAKLFLADLVKPETQFERESQLVFCRSLGLTEVGQARMRHNLNHEFYPLDKLRQAELLDECGFNTPHPFFKALGFSAVTAEKA